MFTFWAAWLYLDHVLYILSLNFNVKIPFTWFLTSRFPFCFHSYKCFRCSTSIFHQSSYLPVERFLLYLLSHYFPSWPQKKKPLWPCYYKWKNLSLQKNVIYIFSMCISLLYFMFTLSDTKTLFSLYLQIRIHFSA